MDNVDQFVAQRQAFLQKMGEGVAVFYAAHSSVRNNDVQHPYRQDSDFYYLTGFDEPNAAVVLINDGAKTKTVLFLRKRNPERERWEGFRLGVERAVETLKVDEAFAIDDLHDKLPELLSGHSVLCGHLLTGHEESKLFRAVERTKLRCKQGGRWPTRFIDASEILHELRRIKNKHEIALMKKAAAITCEAHHEAMASVRPDDHEYSLESVLLSVFRKHGSERVAYPSIVAAGANSTILHYRAGDTPLRPGELVLIDAGCEYGYYASDVTRTFPVFGPFSRAQRAIYELVLDAQLAAIDASVVGATLPQIHQRAVRVLVEGLVRLRILEGDIDELISKEAHMPYYMHKTSHYLGMDVHDVGRYYDDKVARPLEEGVVITVEPGLYFGVEESVPEAYRGIGVRIEDDLVITSDGPLNLTEAAPKRVEDLERICGRKRR